MLDRQHFFDTIRPLFGPMDQDQVDALGGFLDWYDQEMDEEGNPYHLTPAKFAYVLATAFHETARTMAPIAEYGRGKGKDYGKPVGPYGQCYYGRGYVQLTWLTNYEKQDKKLGLGGALVKDADLAMHPPHAMRILIDGMVDGDFTGKKLAHFFEPGKQDFYNARTIVNGHDKAHTIAGYADTFLRALRELPASPETEGV